MTNNNLHAHVSSASRDCDGPMYRDHVVALTEDDRAAIVKAAGVNDFVEFEFKERVLGSVVSFHAEFGATVTVNPHGFDYSEITDEGHRSVSVTWCEDDCDTDAYSQRDVYAEQMGY